MELCCYYKDLVKSAQKQSKNKDIMRVLQRIWKSRNIHEAKYFQLTAREVA